MQQLRYAAETNLNSYVHGSVPDNRLELEHFANVRRPYYDVRYRSLELICIKQFVNDLVPLRYACNAFVRQNALPSMASWFLAEAT